MLSSFKHPTIKKSSIYRDLDGQDFDLTTLDADERALIDDLRRRAAKNPDWFEFDNYWIGVVLALYDARGWSRKKTVVTPLFQIAQDLSSRIAVDQGLARMGDYRDELEILIVTRFKSRRDFCKATGLSEDMLSHVLAGRKDLSIEALTKALGKIGYGLRMVPLPAPPLRRKPVKRKAS